MCVTFFCLKPKSGQSKNIEFLIGFNRDEKTQRDTDPLAPFPEDENIYAGKDRISGGTWLGVNVKAGIMVVLTNYDLLVERYGKSRGKLVKNFLSTVTYEGLSVNEYNEHIKSKLCEVLKERQLYSAFNLLVYSIQTSTVFYICSQMQLNEPKILEPNHEYGMCNGPLDVLWQKTKHGLDKFEKIVKQIQPQQNQKQYFFQKMQEVLKDNVKFDQNLEKEASIFINPYYCHAEKAQRMTKCSFFCMVKRVENGKEFKIEMKQITYTSPQLEESSVQYSKTITFLG